MALEGRVERVSKCAGWMTLDAPFDTASASLQPTQDATSVILEHENSL
jgi:hypothetical protein